MSIARILVRLNNMNNDTRMSIARILVRLNNMNNNIRSRDVYLSSVEGDDIASGGDVVADGGTKSSISGRGRARSS
jgi:hypothetical protein